MPLVKILEYENYFESIALYYANDVNFIGNDDSFQHRLLNKMINKRKNITLSEFYTNIVEIDKK